MEGRGGIDADGTWIATKSWLKATLQSPRLAEERIAQGHFKSHSFLRDSQQQKPSTSTQKIQKKKARIIEKLLMTLLMIFPTSRARRPTCFRSND
jgi:hypothetical protein